MNAVAIQMPEYVKNENGQEYVKGSLKIIVPNSDLVIYVSQKFCSIVAYRGKKTKVVYDKQYNYRDMNARDAVMKTIKSNVDYYISVEESRYNREVENKRKTDEVKKNTKVGDIFFSEWGYEQTNICFYQVIAIKGATYTLREIKKERIEKGNTMTGVVVPLIGDFINDNPFNKRVVDGGFRHDSEFIEPLNYTVNEITGSRIYEQKNYTAYN